MSRLSSEPTALVLMKRPTDLVDSLNLSNFPFERRTRFTTSALTWLHTQRAATQNDPDYWNAHMAKDKHLASSPEGLSGTHLSKNKRNVVLLGQLSLLDGPQWGWSTTVNPWHKHTSQRQCNNNLITAAVGTCCSWVIFVRHQQRNYNESLNMLQLTQKEREKNFDEFLNVGFLQCFNAAESEMNN